VLHISPVTSPTDAVRAAILVDRILPAAIFVVTIIAFLLIRLTPEYIPISYIPFGRTLHEWGLWVVDRGYSFGPEILHEAMQVVITLIVIVLPAALFAILAQRFEAPQKNWAYGAVGTIIGFWLKG
jgi:hypothetical protein